MGDTMKKQIIRTIALATKSDGLKMNRIIIVTSAGIISGKILDEGDAALENYSLRNFSGKSLTNTA